MVNRPGHCGHLPRVIAGALWLALAATALPAAPGGSPPAKGEDGQWSMPSKDYSATRYSTLSQITRANARGLHPVWTFSTGNAQAGIPQNGPPTEVSSDPWQGYRKPAKAMA